MSDPIVWDRLTAAFEAALALPVSERAGFLAEAAGRDPVLGAELAAMLAAHEGDTPLSIEQRLMGDPGPGRTPGAGSLPAGSVLGPWRIDSLIREGGMGEVYRGERDAGEYRQTVAIKILRAHVRSAELVRRFQLERQILASLVHPDIAPILDGGATADGRPFLVMQYVEGLPITEYCDRHRLGLDDRIRLVRRVGLAVQFAHGRLVVHRDLKPSNILVTEAGEPRLLDFGIAKVLGGGETGDDDLATGAGYRLLTPEYAAPEQLTGARVTTATDVYALGVLLFELLTGRRPAFQEGRSLAAVHRAVVQEAPAPSAVARSAAEARRLRGDLDRIVLMALRKEPDRRYASAGQLAEDLERYLARLPVRAQRDTAWYRARKFASRNRVLAAATAAIALLLVLFSIGTALQSRRLTRERDRTEQERRTAESVIGLLTGLFERANPALVPGGDTVRIAALLEEGERRVDSLAGQPALQARMWRVLGNMHTARGRYPRADSLLRRSYLLQRSLPGRDEAALGWTYHELARVVLYAHGPDAARPMFDSSLARLERVLGPDHPSLEEARLDLAGATTDLERRRALLDLVVESQRRRPGTDSLAIAHTLNALGEERFERGRMPEAASLFEASLRILDRVVAREHPDRRSALHNLGAALGKSGDWKGAERLAMEVVELHRKASAPDSAALGNALEALAVTRAYLGRLAESETTLREALGIFRRVFPVDHWHITSTLRNIALVAAARGRSAEGLALLDSVLVRARAASGEDADWAYYAGQRVFLLLDLGRTGEAVATARRAERVLIAGTPPGHVRRADAAMWVAATAFATGDAATAAARFDSARVRFTEVLPPDDPRPAGAECGMGVALAALGRRREAAAHLEPACGIYQRGAFADSVMVRWARAARALLEGGRSPS